jgi:hypothetical protein
VGFSALWDLDDEFRTLLLSSPYIDEPQTDALCAGLKGRVFQLEQLALEQKMQIRTSASSEPDSPGFELKL